MKRERIEDYHKLSELVEEVMKRPDNDNSELIDMLTKNGCSDDLIDKVSSVDYFEATTEQLDKAYMERGEGQFVERLVQRRAAKIRRRVILWSSSVVAAVLAISFYILSSLNSEESTIIVSHSIKRINYSKPTLIINKKSVIELSDATKVVDVQQYAEPATVRKSKEMISMQQLIVPSRNTYTVILDDSTEVTLNANSVLSFPTKFDDGERCVELSGEAYFNVKKSDRPFVVRVKGSLVKVFGTQFNINARSGSVVKTILVSGSVGVGTSDDKLTLISPNQMAIVDLKNHTSDVVNVDVNKYIAWRNGYFRFINVKYSEMLAEISNWYGVNFKCEIADFADSVVTFSVLRDGTIEDMITFMEKISNVKIEKSRNGGDYIVKRLR